MLGIQMGTGVALLRDSGEEQAFQGTKLHIDVSSLSLEDDGLCHNCGRNGMLRTW